MVAGKMYRAPSAQTKRNTKSIKQLQVYSNPELNFHYGTGSANITNSGSISNLTQISKGTGQTVREGNKIMPRYLQYNFSLQKNMGAGSPNHEVVRLIVFRAWIKEAVDGVVPGISPSDVLYQVHPLSFLNPDITGKKGDRSRRIQILRNKMVTLDKQTITSKTYKFSISMNGPNVANKQPVTYADGANNDAISGAIYYLLVSDNATGSDYANFGVNYKLSFYDT